LAEKIDFAVLAEKLDFAVLTGKVILLKTFDLQFWRKTHFPGFGGKT